MNCQVYSYIVKTPGFFERRKNGPNSYCTSCTCTVYQWTCGWRLLMTPAFFFWSGIFQKFIFRAFRFQALGKFLMFLQVHFFSVLPHPCNKSHSWSSASTFWTSNYLSFSHQVYSNKNLKQQLVVHTYMYIVLGW